jgi:hypothetical protein
LFLCSSESSASKHQVQKSRGFPSPCDRESFEGHQIHSFLSASEQRPGRSPNVLRCTPRPHNQLFCTPQCQACQAEKQQEVRRPWEWVCGNMASPSQRLPQESPSQILHKRSLQSHQNLPCVPIPFFRVPFLQSLRDEPGGAPRAGTCVWVGGNFSLSVSPGLRRPWRPSKS